MNTDYARLQMVNQQVRGWNVYDENVLAMLKKLPREDYVPAGFESLAFADTAIPLSHGEYMMTPTQEGRLLQALGLTGDENVLEIGTGSGFMTACLATLSKQVTSIDIYEDFVASTERKLAEAGIDNVELLQMDATQDLPDGSLTRSLSPGRFSRLTLASLRRSARTGACSSWLAIARRWRQNSLNGPMSTTGTHSRCSRQTSRRSFTAHCPHNFPFDETTWASPASKIRSPISNWFGDVVDYNTSRPRAAPTRNMKR